MKKIKVRLRDIRVPKDSIHHAEWVTFGQHQCWIGINELKRIYSALKNGKIYKKRLIYKINAKNETK